MINLSVYGASALAAGLWAAIAGAFASNGIRRGVHLVKLLKAHHAPSSDTSYKLRRGLDLRAMVQERPIRVERRLAAILAADVAGYSRLMHRNEEATHAKLTALLMEAVHPVVAEHAGRIVKNTGDGFLAKFPSAVGAVRAAKRLGRIGVDLGTVPFGALYW